MLIKAALVAVVVAVAAAVFKDGSDLVARQPLSVDDATVQRAAGVRLSSRTLRIAWCGYPGLTRCPLPFLVFTVCTRRAATAVGLGRV